MGRVVRNSMKLLKMYTNDLLIFLPFRTTSRSDFVFYADRLVCTLDQLHGENIIIIMIISKITLEINPCCRKEKKIFFD